MRQAHPFPFVALGTEGRACSCRNQTDATRNNTLPHPMRPQQSHPRFHEALPYLWMRSMGPPSSLAAKSFAAFSIVSPLWPARSRSPRRTAKVACCAPLCYRIPMGPTNRERQRRATHPPPRSSSMFIDPSSCHDATTAANNFMLPMPQTPPLPSAAAAAALIPRQGLAHWKR